ncbi:MAG TPA: hypothetical protein VN969_41600 [Streptosporangiaceae bacterium]|nr:hypothetical protein [Streptosporangiaceae bacterium]
MPTSLGNCDTYCWHHRILIHLLGWTARLNADGTPVLRRPDGTILPNWPPTWPVSTAGVSAGNSGILPLTDMPQ